MIEVSHFARPKALLYPAAQVYEWETTLVVAPYPDHQWLGCAGAIALLRRMGYRVRVLFIGNSPGLLPSEFSYVPETPSLTAALAYLKICEQAVVNFQLQPDLFPQTGTPGFEEAARLMVGELERLDPDSLVVPLLNSDRSDLLATRQIVEEACRQFTSPLRIIEYPLLNVHPADPVTKPTNEYDMWRLDVREVMDDKLVALRELRHQDDTQIPPSEDIPAWETYLEYR